MRKLTLLYTANQQCYSVRYSPFDNSLLACVTCDKFGLTGSASLNILEYKERAFLDSKFSIVDVFRYNFSLFDVEWSPVDPSLLLTANGDGSVGIWKWQPDSMVERKPIYLQKQHSKEVYSIQWEPSGMRAYHFLSASWDKTIKVWNLGPTGLTALSSLEGHDSFVYAGAWNPKQSGILLSASADKKFCLWDVNSSTSSNSAVIFKSQPSQSDVLCCDWNKFDPNVFVLGYASGLIEIRDFRNLSGPPLRKFDMAHDYAIRKVRFSPHIPNLFGSVSYDMHTKLWHTLNGFILDSRNHDEFAYGFDFDTKIPNRVVDCGWDKRVMISEFEIDNRFLDTIHL